MWKKGISIFLLAATVAATATPTPTPVNSWPPPGQMDGYGMMVNPDGSRSAPSNDMMKQREEEHRQMLLREKK